MSRIWERTIDGQTIAHTSDLHIGRAYADHGLDELRGVLTQAAGAGADILLLAGDIFDTNRVNDDTLAVTADLLASVGARVVVLPGNHDPLLPDSAYRRMPLPANVRVIGLGGEALRFDALELEVRGRPHLDYADMRPLPDEPGASRGMRSIVLAHGHYVQGPNDLHRAWLIHDADIAVLAADYLALGHWDRRERVGRNGYAAYYSGSPNLARSINIVRLRPGERAAVAARSLGDGVESPFSVL